MNASIRKQIKAHAMAGTPEDRARFLEEDRAIASAPAERAFHRANFPGKPPLELKPRGYTIPASLVAERAARRTQRLSEFSMARAARKAHKEAARAELKRQIGVERLRDKVETLREKLAEAEAALWSAEGIS